MAAIKIITPTSLRAVSLCLAAMLAAFGAINIFSTFMPSACDNAVIFDRFPAVFTLPFSERIAEFSKLRSEQEALLARNPSDPFAWARLSYLRLVTQGDKKGAFAALRMSDLLSPYEPRQQLERALMWRDLRDAEDAQQREYQDMLWQKAFSLDRSGTINAVRQRGLLEEVDRAMQSAGPELLGDWNSKKAKK